MISTHITIFFLSVQAELPIVPPPEVKCRHTATGGKHFLIVTGMCSIMLWNFWAKSPYKFCKLV